ncbi:MAG TPA: SsrA-binding protein SmpB [Clostridiales bacterium]|jgi:ssrA-binding protein|nr:SsrA-binding protein SmpB [Subdoligranulum sp.]CDE71240.1 ssrA-binding protein [Subdoligranulum sp. CAG:314]HCW81365.1 SsrA-binding protein SmpB [Clostridiales bacterium]
MKIVATNKKAFHDYFVIDSFEAGINLVGCEVKSVRAGEVNLKDSYAVIRGGQLVLVSAYIKNYDKGSFSNVDSRRDRRLLMHRQEIMRLLGKVKEKGFSLVPLKMYLNGSLVKVEIGLVKGKQLYDKKKAIAEKDAERDKQRQLADMKR